MLSIWNSRPSYKATNKSCKDGHYLIPSAIITQLGELCVSGLFGDWPRLFFGPLNGFVVVINRLGLFDRARRRLGWRQWAQRGLGRYGVILQRRLIPRAQCFVSIIAHLRPFLYPTELRVDDEWVLEVHAAHEAGEFRV